MLLFSFPAVFSCFKCSISQICYFLKNQGEQTKQPSNRMTPTPPAPAKKQNALCTSQLLISPQNSTHRWGGLCCLVSFFFFFAFHIANVHTSLMTVEFENIFLVSLQLLAGFFCYYYFYRICLVSVCPNRSWWVIDSFWKRRD